MSNPTSTSTNRRIKRELQDIDEYDSTWNAILRIPKNKINKFEQFFIREAKKWENERHRNNNVNKKKNACNNGKSGDLGDAIPTNLKIKFFDNSRNGQIMFDNEKLNFKIKEFPSIIEVWFLFLDQESDLGLRKEFFGY